MKFSPICKVYELPIDASQKRCSMCPPSAQTHAVRRRHHWHIAETDLVVHLSPFTSAFFLSTATTTSQLNHHKVRAAQVWWLDLIIDVATVSIILVQKMVNIKISI